MNYYKQPFFNIIRKDKLPIRDGIVVIVVPNELFLGGKSTVVVDEYGRQFTLGSPAYYSFRGQIPQWYLDTATVVVEGIHELDEIGDCVALLSE